ncbi:hypothetical protein ACO0LC_10605 [Undibacterium sp. JH2W]
MSVNLHLSLKVSHYHPDRTDAIKQAIKAVFAHQQIDSDMSAIAECSEGGSYFLSSQTDPEMPVIISGSYKWLPEVQQQLLTATEEANGGLCTVEFDGLSADEDNDNELVEDDEEEL